MVNVKSRGKIPAKTDRSTNISKVSVLLETCFRVTWRKLCNAQIPFKLYIYMYKKQSEFFLKHLSAHSVLD